MGYGLGASVGAKIANPQRPVVLFTGDGSFRMNCAELATITNYGAPVLIVLLNNHVLGMVRQWQTLFYDERYAETNLDRPPVFVKLAEAYGFAGFKANNESEFIKALSDAAGGKAIDEQIM
jgi:acetolactate synthase-1/2/3 large subunit